MSQRVGERERERARESELWQENQIKSEYIFSIEYITYSSDFHEFHDHVWYAESFEFEADDEEKAKSIRKEFFNIIKVVD